MDNNTHHNKIGLLYPGEMGSSFGRLLSEHGFTALTTTANRSPRTQRLCHDAGLVVAGSLREVVEQSDTIVSFVSPAAAYAVAEEVADLLKSSFRTPLFMDANSISPETALGIDALMQAAGVDFVDAAVHGLASRLRDRCLLSVSGHRAGEVHDLFGSVLRVRVVGDKPGQASAVKMITTGIAKGIAALFLETMMLACGMGMLNQAFHICDELYPGVMELARRLLPTYPQHAGRRTEELRELERTMAANGVTPEVVHGVLQVTREMANVRWDRGRDPGQWPIADLIEELRRSRITAAASSPA